MGGSGSPIPIGLILLILAGIVLAAIIIRFLANKETDKPVSNPPEQLITDKMEPINPPDETQDKDSSQDAGICPKCGYHNEPENNFCEQCGEKLE